MNDDITVTAPTKGKNFFQKWLGVYFSPLETFASIDRKPDWILPLLVLAIISVATIYLIHPIIKEVQLNAIIELQNMSRDQAEELLSRGGVLVGLMPMVFEFIRVFVAAFIVAGAFYVTNSFVLGGESTYTKVLSVYSYVGLAVGVVGTIVRLPLIMAKQSLEVQTSLAVILSPEAKDQLFYKLLAKFDLFTIWQVLLLIIGFGVIYKFAKEKSALSVLSLWFIYIVISLLLGSIFKGFGG